METGKPDEVGEVGEEAVRALTRGISENFCDYLASLWQATYNYFCHTMERYPSG